jgi:hypothetical protein
MPCTILHGFKHLLLVKQLVALKSLRYLVSCIAWNGLMYNCIGQKH